MISIGNNIQDSHDQLKKADARYLYDAIRSPKPAIASRIRQLRNMLRLDPTQYATLKRQLPYFVCGTFSPPFRKVVNFAYTEHFVLDIDHISEKGMDMASLRSRIQGDGRAFMCFSSPSGDGLKVMFHLSERCYDSSLYKVFYQLFAKDFSDRHNLQQVVDARTCDVSRACFISIDEDAYYDPDCETVRIQDFIDPEANIREALDLKHLAEKEASEAADKTPPTEAKKSIDDDALAHIRQTLNPNSRLLVKKNIFVPPELNHIMDDLTLYVSERGVETTEVININYGKKLRFKLGLKQGEINLFYGRHGFSVVQSPRTGTDPEMNELMAQVVEAFIVEKLM